MPMRPKAQRAFLEGGAEYEAYCDELSNMMDEEVDVYFEHLKDMENE